MAQRRDRRLSPQQGKMLTRASKLGGPVDLGGVRLSDLEMVGLLQVLKTDLEKSYDQNGRLEKPSSSTGYFSMGLDAFTDPGAVRDVAEALLREDRSYLVTALVQACEEIPDFMSAFEALCEIHKRRLKFRRIVAEQRIPEIEDISPRAILEWGIVPGQELESFMRWRKWFYDIDNRAAQETGYMLTKVMSLVLGGQYHSAKTSPIRRMGYTGGTHRSVDCIAGRTAYDFKARMTDAPSRRARLEDELAFARDCFTSGFKPILLVLKEDDPELSQEMIEAYAMYDGESHFGDAAWRHIREVASPTMRRFADLYVRGPMEAVDGDHQLHPMTVDMNPERFGLIVSPPLTAEAPEPKRKQPRAPYEPPKRAKPQKIVMPRWEPKQTDKQKK